MSKKGTTKFMDTRLTPDNGLNRAYVRNLEIAADNQRLINREFDIAIENQKLREGLTPSAPIEESKPYEYRESILNAIKTMTYEPSKFYTMLFDSRQVDIFAERLPAFIKTVGKYRSNLSAEQLFAEWDRYINLTMNKALPIEGVTKKEEREYSKVLHNRQLGYVKQGETKTRKNIEENQQTEHKHLIDKGIATIVLQIEKEMKELGRAIPFESDLAKQGSLYDRLVYLDAKRKDIAAKNAMTVAALLAASHAAVSDQINTKREKSASKIQTVFREKKAARDEATKQATLQNLRNEVNRLKEIMKTMGPVSSDEKMKLNEEIKRLTKIHNELNTKQGHSSSSKR